MDAPGGHSTVVPRADPISAGATSPLARSREPRTGAESTSAIASTHPIPIAARIGTPPRKIDPSAGYADDCRLSIN